MKKKILLSVVLVFTLIFSLFACNLKGDKEVVDLKVLSGLKTEYELNETPDFSGVRVQVIYNDETTKEVGADELTFSKLDTSLVGDKKLTITFGSKSIEVNVKVKGRSIDTVVLTGIEYQSGLPESIYETSQPLDLTSLTIIAHYSDGTKGVVERNKITTNVSELDFSTAGKKTVVIKYQDKTCEYVIEVLEVKIVKIEVDAESIDTVVKAGETLDISNIKVYAIYSNNERILISNTDPKLDLERGMPNFSVEGDKEYIIFYDGLTCSLTISTTPPTLTGITLNTDNALKSILLGDDYSTASITATISLSDGTSKTIANSDLDISCDVTKAGVSTVTVSYTLDEITMTASYEVKVLTIAKVEIDTNSFNIKINTGDTLDVSGLKVIVTDSEGGTRICTIADGVTVDTSNLDTTKVGDTGYITATFRDVTSEPVNIGVYDEDTNYFVTGVSLSPSLTLYRNSKKNLKNDTYGYVVGDDNPFIFNLVLSIYTSAGEKVENMSSYTSASEVWLDGAKLTGSDLEKYVTIDESTHSFDFTEEAIGKTFTLRTRPRDGVEGFESDFTRALDVTVVDAYNVYEAWELNFITNYDGFNSDHVTDLGDNAKDQVTSVKNYLETTHGITEMPNINGVVIHNDLFIKPADLPIEYFVDADRNNELYDYLDVYSHYYYPNGQEQSFTIHGNYFTICSNALPTVCAPNTGNQGDSFSNSQLFGFFGPKKQYDVYSYADEYFKYKTVFSNVYIRDDHPSKNEIQTANRDMRGLIGLKSYYHNVELNNTRFDAFYISYLAESDYQVVDIVDCIFYNSWQNHLFIWSDNPYISQDDESDDIPGFTMDNYPTLRVNLINTSVTKCGGPAIISQATDPKKDSGRYCGATIDIDKNSEVWSYVTGTEAWFNAMGMESQVSMISAMGQLLSGVGGSFTTTKPPIEGDLGGAQFMNVIGINMSVGKDLGASDDIDGKYIVGDYTVVDMADGIAGGYTSPLVSLIKKMNNGLPVFVSSEGGVGMLMPEVDTNTGTILSFTLITDVYQALYKTFVLDQSVLDHATFCNLVGIKDEDFMIESDYASGDPATIQGIYTQKFAAHLKELDTNNATALGEGEFITLYHNSLALLFGYNVDENAEEENENN